MTIGEWDRRLLGLTREEYARRKRREALGRWLDAAAEIATGVIAVALIAASLWAFLAFTPDGVNGDGETVEAEMAR